MTECAICGLQVATSTRQQARELTDCITVVVCDCGLAAAIQRGSEPYWMADIRLAQRHIDAARLRSRPSRPAQSE